MERATIIRVTIAARTLITEPLQSANETNVPTMMSLRNIIGSVIIAHEGRATAAVRGGEGHALTAQQAIKIIGIGGRSRQGANQIE